jgi:hypothetical protein
VLLGLGARLLEATVAYAGLRRQFDRPVGSFQAVKHHLAEARVALDLARPTVAHAAACLAHRHADAPTWASMAKLLASEAALETARASLQCHGAIGYSYEHDLHFFMKRVWSLAAASGDAASHLRRITERLLGPSQPRGSHHA